MSSATLDEYSFDCSLCVAEEALARQQGRLFYRAEPTVDLATVVVLGTPMCTEHCNAVLFALVSRIGPYGTEPILSGDRAMNRRNRHEQGPRGGER